MDVGLLRKYRRMACKKFCLIEERAEYPRCRYRWMHDKEEFKPRYILCDNGNKVWDERQRCFVFSRNLSEALKILQDYKTMYIKHLLAKEMTRRCNVVKTIKIKEEGAI